MRILLTSNASYAPPRGGSTRSNLAWLRHLAERGTPLCRGQRRCGSQERNVQQDRIEIHSSCDLPRRASVLGEHIRAMQPDWVLVSSEDLSHVLLREADAGRAAAASFTWRTRRSSSPSGRRVGIPTRKATGIIRARLRRRRHRQSHGAGISSSTPE